MAGRLFRYDVRIAINALNAAFRWHERLMVLVVLAIGVVATRSWSLDHPWLVGLWVALGCGALIGFGCGRAISARLAFHSADGLLAMDALITGSRRRYTGAWHLCGMALLAVIAAWLGPWLLAGALAGYAAGAVVTYIMGIPERSGLLRHLPTGHARQVRSWLQRPGAGLWTGALLVLSLALLSPSLSPNALSFAAGLQTVVLMLALTIVDDGVVRFMAMAGFGPWTTLLRHIRGGAAFLALSAPICVIAFGFPVGGVVGSVGLVALLLVTLRVLAYRLHGKRFADLLLTALAGLLAFVAISMPVLLPVMLVLILWPMQRRASARTWLVA